VQTLGGLRQPFILVGPPGIEPGSAGYEPDVLPLRPGRSKDYQERRAICASGRRVATPRCQPSIVRR